MDSEVPGALPEQRPDTLPATLGGADTGSVLIDPEVSVPETTDERLNSSIGDRLRNPTVIRIALVGLIVLLTAAFVALAIESVHQSAVVATELISLMIAALAMLALIAAMVAIAISIPTWLKLFARPRLKLSVAIGEPGALQELRQNDTKIQVRGLSFRLRIHITNMGTGPADANLNLFVPPECELVVEDSTFKEFYRLDKLVDRTDSQTGDVVVQRAAMCRYRVMYPTLLYVYGATVTSPTRRTCPIEVRINRAELSPYSGATRVEPLVRRFEVVTS